MPSRNEQYLEAAVNKSGTDGLPEPRTRNEKLLHRLVEEVSSGGLPEGGSPYQQLVTDGDGNTKWEEKLCYSESLTSVPYPDRPDSFWYKVSDSIPTGDVSIGTECTVSNGDVVGYGQVIISETDYYAASDGTVIVTLKDNVAIQGISATFPEKGTYFLVAEAYGIKITGFSIGRVTTPEITWDGTPTIIKKLDEKFLPDDYINTLIDAKLGVIENGSY